MDTYNIETDTFEFNVDDKLKPTIERQLTGKTKLDLEIESLPIPSKGVMIKFSIQLIRWYQEHISKKLGNRCVFDPSCSHYCELSIRNSGLFLGFFYTIKRLYRCRPGNGGVDMPITRRGKHEIQN